MCFFHSPLFRLHAKFYIFLKCFIAGIYLYMTVDLRLAGDPLFRLCAKLYIFFKCFRHLLKSNDTSVMTVALCLAGDPMFRLHAKKNFLFFKRF